MNTNPITYNPSPSRPTTRLPAGATDTHCHVFGPTAVFPFAADAAFTPGDAPKETLFALHDMLGIERCVVVQSGCHGFDNAVVADAIAARPDRYLGIALLPPDVADAEIVRLTGQGFRGVRYNYMGHLAGGASPDELRALAPRLARHGWHLQIHLAPERMEEMAPLFAEMPVPVVIDHMARVDASLGIDQPAFTALRRLLDKEHVWVKVSGSERISADGPPWDDGVRFARVLVEDHPDHVLWGTDFPHPNFKGDPPDDGMLVDLLPKIAPTDDHLRRLLVDNPARLYGFA
ncbi:amidohydrolase family protein [Acuticoccus sp. 2012]|uniref:Amidohydrolase family protein n=2 Tax=Acuticoccus mangrovi TaxID=2796142 RepID=A0A934MHU0_9HYPH|nr:amidohydrolase family protein [Acuticoccus mangrovi]MBJ3778033.1 amidohydrolase family protein [Acuticoccus mangrovi]